MFIAVRIGINMDYNLRKTRSSDKTCTISPGDSILLTNDCTRSTMSRMRSAVRSASLPSAAALLPSAIPTSHKLSGSESSGKSLSEERSVWRVVMARTRVVSASLSRAEVVVRNGSHSTW